MNNIEKNLEKIFEKLNITNEWETRKAAMNDLGKIAAKAELRPLELSQLLKPVVGQLEAQLSDRRSIIIKEACHVVSVLSESLKLAFEPHAEVLIPALLKLVVVTVLVMAESSDKCIQLLIKNCRAMRILPRLVKSSLSEKSSIMRARCSQYVFLVLLDWGNTPEIQRNVDLFEEMIKGSLVDAVPEVRLTGRRSFFAFKAIWPQKAANIFSLLGSNIQKILKDEEKSLLQYIEDKRREKEINRNIPSGVISERSKCGGRQAFSNIDGNSQRKVEDSKDVIKGSLFGSKLRKSTFQDVNLCSSTIREAETKSIPKLPLLGAIRTAGAVTNSNLMPSESGKFVFKATKPEDTSAQHRTVIDAGRRKSEFARKGRNRSSVGGATRIHIMSVEKDKSKKAEKLLAKVENVEKARVTAPLNDVIRRLDFVDEVLKVQMASETKSDDAKALPPRRKSAAGFAFPKLSGQAKLGGAQRVLRALKTVDEDLVEERIEAKKPEKPVEKRNSNSSLNSKSYAWGKPTKCTVLKSEHVEKKSSGETTPKRSLESQVKSLASAKDWNGRLKALKGFEEVLRDSTGKDAFLQDPSQALKLLAQFVENPHAKVALSAISTLSFLIQICRPFTPSALIEFLPAVFSRLADSQSQIREEAKALLGKLGGSALLPSVALSLVHLKAPRTRLAVLQYTCQAIMVEMKLAELEDTKVDSSVSPIPTNLPPVLAQITLSEKNVPLKKAALSLLSLKAVHLDRTAVLQYVGGCSTKEREELVKGLSSEDPSFEEDLRSFLESTAEKPSGSVGTHMEDGGQMGEGKHKGEINYCYGTQHEVLDLGKFEVVDVNVGNISGGFKKDVIGT